MHRLHLPESQNAPAPAFAESATAETWLAGLASKPAAEAQAAILEQVEAIDGSALAPPQAITLLSLLRSAAVARQAGRRALEAGHDAREASGEGVEAGAGGAGCMTEYLLSDVAAVESGAGFPVVYQGVQDAAFPFLKVSDMNLSGNERAIKRWNHSISEQVRGKLRAKVLLRIEN